MKVMGKIPSKMRPVRMEIGRSPIPAGKAFGTLMKIDQCPRNINDVYGLGVRLHNYILDRYLELAALDNWSEKSLCENLAGEQLKGRQQIESMAEYNLNRMLTYFYNNGGPVIEDPVSEMEARLILPFFTRIMVNFEKHVHALLMSAIKGQTLTRHIEASINGMLISTYSAISDLYQNADMQDAFMELADVTRQYHL